MKTKQILLLSAVLFASAIFARAQIDTNGLTAEQMAQVQKIYALVNNLKYQSGEIDVHGGLAKLSLAAGVQLSRAGGRRNRADQDLGQPAVGHQAARHVDAHRHDAAGLQRLGGDD